uniref:RING-type domain-containing protein n=1 Tax=Globodera pallida TaxID=36090 RepID=A0A183C0C6_GLOPA
MQRLQRQLIDQGTLEAYAALRLTDRNWAQINDSILVALLLQRPVVVLSPSMSVNDCALLGPRWNDTRCAQFMHVFFPDGQMRMITRTIPHAQLQHFTMQQELAPGQIDTREVTPSVHNTAAGLDIILDQTHVPLAMTLPGPVPAQQQPPTEVGQQQQEDPLEAEQPLSLTSVARTSTPSAPGGARDILDQHESITSESGSDCNEGREESVPPTSAHSSGENIGIEAAKLVIKLNARLLHPLRLEMEQKQQELLAAQAAEAKPMLLSQPNFLKLKRQQCAAIESLQKELNFVSEQFQFHLEEARKIEAILKAAADPAFRLKQKKRLTEFVEETPVAACPPVKQQCCEQIFECADHLYNTAWTFICLWYTLMQIDPHTASLECLADWRKQSGRCSSKLYRLQDAWEDNASLLEEELEKTAKFCRKFKPQKQTKSGMAGALKSSVKLIRKLASRRPASLPKPTAQLFRALFKALHQKDRAVSKKIIERQRSESTSTTPNSSTSEQQRKKCADASNKRLMQAAECSTIPNSELQKEKEDFERRKSADQRMQAKLQRIEQQLEQHIHRQKNLAVRNLMWDREAALEQRIRERYHTFRAEIEQLRQSSIETGDLDNYAHCLANDAAINAFCQALIDLASQDANADVDEKIRKHKEVIEREERGLAEQQRWRNFVYEQRDAETAFDRHHNPQAAWGLSDEIRRLNNEHQQTVEALRAQQPGAAFVCESEDEDEGDAEFDCSWDEQQVEEQDSVEDDVFDDEVRTTPVNDYQFNALMQPDPEAVRAHEIIEQRLGFREGDYVEEVVATGKKAEDKGPDPHPHFTSLDMHILNRETAHNWHKEQKVCEICREPLLRGDLITELPCHPSAKHVFHTICLRRWLATNRTPPNAAHLRAFNEYVAEESQHATTLRVPDNDFVIRAWREYEQLRRGERDEYGSTIRPPMAPRRALQQVLQRIRGGRFDQFGGQQLEWDASDPRNDAAVGLNICETLLHERMLEDEEKEKNR